MIHLRFRINKTIKKTFITAFILLVLFLIAGTIYVLVSDRNPIPIQENKTAVKQQQLPNAFKPKLPGANAPEGVAVASLTSPVKAGTNASISILTNARSTCKISVTYKDKTSTDSGLVTKKANDYGSVTWTWSVESTVPAGKWPVKVTCVYNKKSGVVIADLQVTK